VNTNPNSNPSPHKDSDVPTAAQIAAELAHACKLSPLDRLKMWSVVLDSVRYVVVWGIATADGARFIGGVGKSFFWRN
jgi:hypothetical protein